MREDADWSIQAMRIKTPSQRTQIRFKNKFDLQVNARPGTEGLYTLAYGVGVTVNGAAWLEEGVISAAAVLIDKAEEAGVPILSFNRQPVELQDEHYAWLSARKASGDNLEQFL